MSDEQNQQQNPNTTIDLDAKVLLGGTEVNVRDLATAREELAKAREEMDQLSKFREAALTVMRQDVPADMKTEAARQLLRDSGFPEDEIDRQVGAWAQGGQEDYEMVDENEDPEVGGQTEEDDDADVDLVAQSILDAQNRAAVAEEEVRRIKAERLGTHMNDQITGAIDSVDDGRTLLGKLRELNGDEAAKNARAAIERDIRQTTLDMLRSRRDAAGTFNEAWVAEEARRATESVIAKYRSVIGDPNKLGRAPETASGSDYFASRKPVPAPKWKPGMRTGDVDGLLQDYNTDVLSRLASGLDNGKDRV
jgi:uncharacterized small protein (DUF1192 family)